MYFRRGNNWSLTIYTDPHLLMALYLRELAGVNPAEVGPNCRLEPDVKERTGPHSVHGQIKQEWGSWWDSLTTHDTAPEVAVPVPANLLEWLEDNGYPELARLARPHYGQATLFAHQHTEDFERRSRDYIPDRMDEIEQLLIERRQATQYVLDDYLSQREGIDMRAAADRRSFLMAATLDHAIRQQAAELEWLDAVLEHLP